MNNKMRIKKSMSIMLLFAMILSMFGATIPGPDSKAVAYADFGRISMKSCNFDVGGYDYDECNGQTLYEGYTVSLFFKRMTGCRIPKGSVLYLIRKNDYEAVCSEGLTMAKIRQYCYSFSNPTRLNYNEVYWKWKNGLPRGKYIAMLYMPYTYNRKTYYRYYWWNVKVNRYG